MTRITDSVYALFALALVACGSSQVAPADTASTDREQTEDAEDLPAAAAESTPPDATDGSMSIDAPPDVAAAPPDAEVTPSGLASRLLRAGTGTVHPTAEERVTVHYVGWTTDGERFDSSIERGEPATFPLNRVIGGWTEGVQLMVEGERRRFWIPANLAYGENPRPGAPAGMLVFDIELIRIER